MTRAPAATAPFASSTVNVALENKSLFQSNRTVNRDNRRNNETRSNNEARASISVS